MATNGLIIPILVRPEGDRFIIVHGERRYQAALSLVWDAISAEVRDISPEEAQWLALVENVQRNDLSPLEEARAYRERLAGGITQKLLGERIGKSQSYIAQKLRLLKLPSDAQEAIGNGITEGHARQLLRLHDTDQQSELCKHAVVENWTVKRTHLEVNEALRQTSIDELPTTAAEVIIWFFERKGRIPGHDPYPEERFPDKYDPPMEVKQVPVRKIIITDKVRNLRSERDPGYAEWLAEIFVTLPPVAVFPYGRDYVLADGIYRMMAASLLGLQEIECRVYEDKGQRPVKQEAEHYGVAANSAQNSIPLTKDELETFARRHKQAVLGGD